MEPYRLFATDEPMHMPGSPQPLYGSIPYVSALTSKMQSSVLWINSAQTIIDIDHASCEDTEGSIATFTSESGALEFFLFASTEQTNPATNRVKRVLQDLATVTGYAPLPMIQTLGFHFSKWAPVSAQILEERSRTFTEEGFPVDVLWADIQWAQQNNTDGAYHYFQFNPKNFTEDSLRNLHNEIFESGRRLTLIFDPHIKVTEKYKVYTDGWTLHHGWEYKDDQDVNNIFVRKNNKFNDAYEAPCWPGNSVWIDFLNENAADFWSEQYSSFKI